jgi:perosamine synthetase
MPVHVYGQAADLDPILEIAKKYDLRVVEDAAQGYGVLYKGKHVGCVGDVGIISFFADKTVTTGEGAVLLTNSDEIYERLRYLRNQGRLESSTFIHPELGMNFRMTDLQCAVGVAQLNKFQEIKRIKCDHYDLYKAQLIDMEEIELVEEVQYSNIVPFRANIKVSKLKDLMEYLDNNGIQTRGFFCPLHRQPCFSYLGYVEDDFPVSNRLYATGLCLPVHCGLTEDDILYICDTIKRFYSRD